MHYVVIEIQKYDTIATLVNSYDNRDNAYSKYYLILSAAAISQVPLHAAVILTEDGEKIDSKVFYHQTEQEEQ